MFQFPASPILGQLYTPSAGITFRWNGTAWYLVAGAGAFITQADGDARYLQLANYSPRNAIINGDMAVWQRGTSLTGVSATRFTADRWKHVQVGTGVFTIAQALGPVPLQSSMQCAVTTADASLAAGDIYAFRTVIEGYDWGPLRQQALTLSFWVQSSVTGTYSVSLLNGGSDRNFAAAYTINVANTWEFKTISIPASPLTGTWDYANGVGLNVLWGLGAGTDWHSPTMNAWFTPTGSVGKMSPSQVNFAGTLGANFFITGVQLERGTAFTSFEALPISEQLSRCLRYFHRWGKAGALIIQAQGFIAGGTVLDFCYQTPQPMRIQPVMEGSGWSWSGTSAPSGNQIGAFVIPTSVFMANTHSTITPSFTSTDGLFQNGLFRITGSGGAFTGTVGSGIQLYTGTTAYIDFNADF